MAAYAVFNDKVLPNWHPVSQPEVGKARKKNYINLLFQSFLLLFTHHISIKYEF